MKKQLLINLSIILIALSPILYLLIAWNSIPMSFVTRFDFSAVVEEVQTREKLLVSVLTLSIISSLVYLLLLYLKKVDPKVTDETPSSSFHKLGIVITLFFVVVNYLLILSAQYGWTINTRVAIGLFGFLIMVIGNYMNNLRPNYVAGIRLPWTLNDPENWRKTHEFAGKLWFGAGILLIIISLILAQSILMPVVIILLIILVVVPGIYSYRMYRSKLN